jgi:predicted component of type VI protein secretion system
MEVKLVVAHGKNAGQKIAVAGPKFFIGRADDCQLRPNSDLVSRHHCVVLIEEGFVAVRDFGSKNGTFVNDEQVRAEQELKNGDRLRIGQLEFTVELAVPVGGKKKPKVHSIQEAAARAAETGAASPEELDLDSLLGDAEASDLPLQTETQPLAGAASAAPSAEEEATQSAIPKTQESGAIKEPAAQAKAPPPKKTEPPKKPDSPNRSADAAQAWKGIKEKKPDAASSRDAAADMLKQMFNRGKR